VGIAVNDKITVTEPGAAPGSEPAPEVSAMDISTLRALNSTRQRNSN
jgi:hypothetical protein